ncbi:MAG: TIGR03790 family protein [Methylacidiphilales bacterium]|nr:TIGR03790 family protein [Candidatus Methylacidiphilales bacterium]
MQVNPSIPLLFLLPCLAAIGQTTDPAPAQPERELNRHVMVVYNENEPSSESLARYYAQARNIGADHVLGIRCPADETVSRKAFEEQIRQPIDDYLTGKGWFKRIECTVPSTIQKLRIQRTENNPIWALVLIRGIPLRIEEDSTLPPLLQIAEPLRPNRAAVDSELALLPCLGFPAAGFVPNPYYSEKFIRPFSQAYADWMILVARLDGPQPSDVRAMIDSAIETEKIELTGRAYFDSRNITDPKDPYFIGDDWMRQAADAASKAGLETSLDTSPEVVPADTPWDAVALYGGWYTQDCSGPFLQPDFRFQPGAIAYHLHSFSAESIRSPDKFWVGPLVSRGVAATMGSVYEPYLKLTPNVYVFFRNLLAGLSFGEAAYQSEPALSWTITMVGDPLYRPFPRHLFESVKLAADQKSEKLPWLILRMCRLLAAQNERPLEERLNQMRTLSKFVGDSGSFQEGYADILFKLNQPPEEIISAYRQAALFATSENTAIRASLKLADYYIQLNRPTDAFAVYDSLMQHHPAKAVYFQVPQIAAQRATQTRWRQLSTETQKEITPPQPKP